MSTRKKGIAALLLLSLVWASFGLPIRYLSGHFTYLQQIYLRTFVSALGAILIFNKGLNFLKLFRMPKKEWAVLLFRVICVYGFAVIFYTQAFTLTTFGEVSFLGAIPTTAVLGFILLREKVTLHKVALILLSVIGILFITVKNPAHFFQWGRGDELALISDLFFSLSYIGRKWQSNFLNNKEISMFMVGFGALLIFALSLIRGEPLPSIEQFSIPTWAVITAAGLLNVASQFLVNYGFSYVEAALASNIVSLESFWAVIFGFIFYRELLSLQAFFGGLLILASVVFLNKEEEQEKKKK
ncbi:MAG: DMT family transporter [Patescibacteria group bacterium]|nr:DMT family transporter [Patescibacteria group bacterium]